MNQDQVGKVMMQSIKLITALGNMWLICEIIDFFNGGDRFRYEGEAAVVRSHFAGAKLTDIYIVCTQDVDEIFKNELKPMLAKEYPNLRTHPIRLPCKDISCDNDDEIMRQLVYETVRKLAADNLVISSGGRKTLTNRIIEAGLLYGCMGYLTITAPRGKERASDIRYRTTEFGVLWISARRFSEERRRGIVKEELGDNFRSLYLLPTTMLDRLRHNNIGADQKRSDEDIEWIRQFPKADLHCHLGGSFDVDLLKEMAKALICDLNIGKNIRRVILQCIEHKIGKSVVNLDADDLLKLRNEKNGSQVVHCLQNLECIFNEIEYPVHVCVAVLLNALSLDQIEKLAWHEIPNVSNKNRLQWYMSCGDFGGSSLLQTEGNIRRALRWLMKETVKENVWFLEVRFSPGNYTRAGYPIHKVISCLIEEANSFMALHEHFQLNFLIMATRHKDSVAMEEHVKATVSFGKPSGGRGSRITGFDLAGQEEGNDPSCFQEIIEPLHLNFMNVTIHAGEMAEDDKIWQALYLLHARRIGHGLKLVNNKKMMGYVRDYGIGIEMCPSSNWQTNGFRRYDLDETGPSYPLKEYLDFGLATTINTDNRGISRTTLSEEYLKAAKMTLGGLSKWEVLRLIKNTFKAAFLPKNEKDVLLKVVDEKVFSLVLDDFFPGDNQ